MDTDVKAAIQAVADDWRDTHNAGGDCVDFANELLEILLPMVNRGEVSRKAAPLLVIHAGNYADGSDPEAFTEMLAGL